MGSENDIESFIQLQKQKLAQEREQIHLQEKRLEMPELHRKHWDAPSRLDFTQNSEPAEGVQYSSSDEAKKRSDKINSQKDFSDQNIADDMFSKLGQHEAKRKALEKERHNEYLKYIDSKGESRTDTTQGNDDFFSKLGQYESKRKVLDLERQNEYNKLQNVNAIRTTGRDAANNSPNLPGYKNGVSIEEVKRQQRNAEYNAFLQLQEEKLKNKFADKKGQSPQKPQNVPISNPIYTQNSYEELLQDKRRQENNYRRQNDPDGRRPLHANNAGLSNFDRYNELDRAYEKKKVKFENDRTLQDDPADVYHWLQKVKEKFGVTDVPSPRQDYNDNGRSRSFYKEAPPQPVDQNQRSKSVPPTDGPLTGLQIGKEDTASAVRRRKEQYRQDLLLQIENEQRTTGRRSQFSKENLISQLAPSNQQYAPQKSQFRSETNTILDDRRPLASILNERRDLIDTSPRLNYVPSSYNPGVLEKGFTGLYEPSALARLNQPPAQPILAPQTLYPNPYEPAYSNYGNLDPLANFSQPQFFQPQLINGFYNSGVSSVNQTSNIPVSQPQQTAVGAIPLGITNKEEIKKTNQLSYQVELKRQMEEKQKILAAKKAEEDAYNRKLEDEIANYNPFGRAGGGAPMKDGSGNVVADLRSMNLSNKGLTPRLETNPTPAPQQTIISSPRYDPSLLNNNSPISLENKANAQTHARGGNGIFGEPKTDAQKTAADKYKEELQRQIEEKKRVAELEKQKIKEEEERELRRIEEERKKIQREFEEEQVKARAKEEETKRKNEELKKATDEQKRLAEEKKREKIESKRKVQLTKGLEDNNEDPSADLQRNESPPIPTLRSKTQPPGSNLQETRSDSPPLPAQRSKTQHEPVKQEPKPQESPVPVQQFSEPTTAAVPQNRVKSAEVLNQLAHMRAQLQQERQRVENALNKQKLDVDVYDERVSSDKQKEINVFEIARSRKPVSAARRQKAEDAGRIQEDKTLLKPPGSATSLLQSDSAFVDATGLRAAFPDDFDTLAANQNARRRRRERLLPSKPEKDSDSVVSVNPDRITRKNQDRLRKLKAIAGDDISIDDPDDIIDRFMMRQTHNRPPSGQTLTDDTWLDANR